MIFPGPTAKQARILWISLTALALGVLVTLMGVLLWACGWILQQLSPVLLPLAMAAIIAYLLDPVVDFFIQRNLRRSVAIGAVFFLTLAIFLGLIGSVIPRMIEEISALEQQHYPERLAKKLNRLVERPPFNLPLPQSWIFWHWRQTNAPPATNVHATNFTLEGDLLLDTNLPPTSTTATNPPPAPTGSFDSQWVIRSIARVLPGIGSWMVSQLSRAASLAGLLIGFALVPIYTFYFLWEKKAITENWTNYLPIQESAAKQELVFILKSINYYLILFFRGQVLVALCDGVLLTIGFFLIGLDFAILLGFIAGILSIVPYLGIVVSLVPALTLAAVQFGDWVHPLLVLLNFTLVQTLEGLVISPKIMGDRVGLHPLTIIVAVMIGTTLIGGILGGILAIPLTAALRVLMFRYVWKTHPSPVPFTGDSEQHP